MRLTALISLTLLPLAACDQQHNYTPERGYVPDGNTAIIVGKAVLANIYGREQIAAETPFTAKLVGGKWVVEGYLPPDVDGGVAEIHISKQTGEVLRVTHGK